MQNNVIEFKNVTKIYKLFKNDKQRLISAVIRKYKPIEKVAVNDLSFQIEKGEAVAILGKN
ncbi:MAG: ABC transporter ATP-binding protein, partial [Oscillospiraceae bacterium]|nr:ABC transporter ATP-binding protein [Oscillospiraceae bacterium]